MMNFDQIQTELGTLSSDYAQRLWVQYTTGLDLGLAEARKKNNDFKKNPELYRLVCDTLAGPADAAEKRKAAILKNEIREFHQSEKVQKIFEEIQTLQNQLMDLINKFRCEIGGKEMPTTEIRKILAEDPNREHRRQAYQASAPLNQKLVDAGFLKLLDLRRELAVAAGQPDYVSYALVDSELPVDLFADWQQICAERRGRYQNKINALAQTYLNLETLAPWDERYLKTKISGYNQAEADMNGFFGPISRTFAKFGFDIDKLNITYDIFPRKNKSEWGYNFTIAISQDSRVLANVTNRFSNYNVLLHETAHAVHFLTLNADDVAYHPGISSLVSEGFANFFGSLSYSREFLNEIFAADQAEKAYTEFQELRKLDHLQSFQSVSRILFDKDLYLADIRSAQDIQDLLRRTETETLGRTSHDEIPWANLIHHTGYPIYLHNYFLGDVMCEKMKQVFARHQGVAAEDQPLAFGSFWRDKVLRPSGRYPLPELFEKICEEKMSIEGYMESAVR